MKRPRPRTVAVVGLGGLLLGLGLWWLTEIVDTPGPGAADPAEVVPSWILADAPGGEPPDAPTLAPAKPPAGRRPPPRPEPIVPDLPEAVEPPGGGGEGGPFEEPRRKRPRKKDERGVLDGSGARADIDWRSGSVGRTDATATREILVPEGTAWIGTPQRWVEGLARARGPKTYGGLLYEAPRHPVKMRPYYIDRFELKNHEYFRYLEEAHTVVYNTSDHEPRSLVEIAQVLILEPPLNLDFEDGVAWQLFQANKLKLLDVFKNAIVADPQGVVDEEKTFLRIRDKLVPNDVRLAFYDAAPPGTWPSTIYRKGLGGYPVRDVSLEEAMAFAHFEGRHVPGEIEWEYAARGPRGLDYPWGSRAEKLELLVNGGKVFGRDEEPRTVPVVNHPEGVSWIGCFNMLGNVAEWTTSFLAPYPGSKLPPLPPSGRVLVTRGGSAEDEDPYLLRPAFRGWPGGQPARRPRPNLRLPWTGFRTARHEAVGFSRTVGMHYLVRRGARLDPALLEPEIYDAWQGVQFDHFVREFEDDLTRPGVKTLCVQPLTEVGVRLAGETRTHANTSEALVELEALTALSYTSPVIVGLFQHDLHLVSTWHASGRGAERLFRARCPPGVWFVALFQGRLALVRPDFGDVFFLSNREAPKATFNVLEQRSRPGNQKALPRSLLTYRAGGDDVRAELQSQLYRKGDRTWVVHMEIRLTVERQEAVVVRNWEHGRRTERRP